ncbi:hypothetical protein M0R45_009089 [Rubus argutus]|uniref:WRKY domain-containing protein n=1 Tax=Rubus argutus TaxID=59490 RepID=A0AAW1Y3Q0_RUBAR
MHDLPQEIGRGIVQSEKPWKHSRLWNYEDVQNVLTQNKAMKVEGIMVELSNSGDICLDAEAVASMTNLRLLRITYPQYSNQFDEFLRFEGGRWPKQYLRQPENCRQQLNGDPKFLSHKLMVLAWHGCPLKSLPFNFDPKNLVDLDMRYSLIEQLWQGTKSVKELISINLSYCRDLNKIPVCTEAPKLEKLFLEDCRSLLEVDQSISALKNLVFLSLKGCTELKILPSSIHLMKSLKILNLCGCSNLEMFPEILEDMEALLKLELGYSGIRELPSSIERLRRLESLNMIHCRSLVSLPDSICNLAELRYLNLTWCSKLCNLPENLGNLQSLRVLEAREIGIKQLPVSILRLNLGRLKLNGSKQMEAPLSSWPSSIEDCCTVVVHIDLSYCNLLELSDAIAYFPSLKILRLSRNNLESLPAIMNRLVFLEQLELDGCKRLKSIPELSSSISYINGHDCTALETVSTPKRPYDMGRCFTFSNCSQLVQEDIFRDIVETHSPPQGNYSRPFYMSFPGSEMPGWFRHQCRGSSVTAQLPPNWFDNKFLGFAICAVTNTPQGFGTHYKLTAQCFCTFRGNRCEYRFSFYLFDGLFFIKNSLESNHMLMGYVPWSEFGINGGEEVNERRYTEATFEVLNDKGHFGGIKCCGVRFFFANNEEVSHQDFGEPMVHYERSLEGCSAEPITNDEDEQYLKLSELFDGANRNSREYDSESDCEIEDNDSSGKRKILSRWTQEVRVASGLKQGHQDDGFSWMWYSQGYQDEEMQYIRSKHRCIHKPSCSAKSKVRTSIDDPTILEITYIGRHTCWKTLPMLTHQVRVALGMAPEGPFDGFSWGKYGQMDILGAKYPRVCYVCIPPNVRGCMAIKEVQLCDDDQKILKITYRGRHTCIQASTVSIGGWCDDRIFEGGGALRIHDRLEEDDPIDFEEALDFNGLMERTREVMESGDDQPNESNSISNNNP